MMSDSSDRIYLGIMTDALNVNADEVAERMGVDSVIFTCDKPSGKISVTVEDHGNTRRFELKMARR